MDESRCRERNIAVEKKYYLGLDSSTQGTKLVLLSFAEKRPCYVDAVNYDKDLPEFDTHNGVIRNLGEGVSESDPRMWIQAIHILFGRLKNAGYPPKDIRVISVSGQQHGLVSLDTQGNLTRKRSKLWNDVSTYPECEEIITAVGGKEKVIEEVFNTMKPGYTASKILNFKKNNPEGYQRTSTFFLVHNYVNWFLTGGGTIGARMMEPGDTSGMALWNPVTGKWSDKICRAISHDLMEKLPELQPADQCIGRISQELAERYGFARDCRIDAGSGDNMYGAVGTGNVKEGIVTISLGTSGTAYTVFKKPFVDEEGEIASFCDSLGNYLPLLCTSNLANGYNHILQQQNIGHEEFAAIVHSTPPGNGGRLLLPWFGGERTPDLPQGTPVFFGFGLDDFTIEIISRAVLEGHIMNLYEGYLRLPLQAETIHLTGGLSRSSVWRQTIADIFNCTVIPVQGEGAALGAAIHAAYVDHKDTIGDVAEFVNQFIEFDEPNRTRPIPENVRRYDQFKKIYLALSPRVRGVTTFGDPFRERMHFIS